MKKLNCSFPWTSSRNQSTLQTCGSKHKVKDLVELIKKVNTGELMDEVATFGCNVSNCKSVKWRISSSQNVEIPYKGKVWFGLVFPSSSKVLVVEESLAYTMSNLLADFGGYAGIFVGASIINLYDSIIHLAKTACSFCKRLVKK